MATYNKELWQTVVFLFLSKLVKQAKVSFCQKELTSSKNIDLASRFVQMVGDLTAEPEIKAMLLKALELLEKEKMVERITAENLQLSEIGFAKMEQEVAAAMTKISQNFPKTKIEQKAGATKH